MIREVSPCSQLSGSIAVPGSKSHTIRAVVAALLAEGTSEIHAPLYSFVLALFYLLSGTSVIFAAIGIGLLNFSESFLE